MHKTKIQSTKTYGMQTHRCREQTCGCQGKEGAEEGRNGRLGLAEVNYYT